jgi:hypothetical protein
VTSFFVAVACPVHEFRLKSLKLIGFMREQS